LCRQSDNSKFGEIQSNTKRYGAGYDAYINTDMVRGVDIIYEEFISKGVNVISKPNKTDYGSYEFVLYNNCYLVLKRGKFLEIYI
jgi:uncharacterized glyoxalase superfamily protein PhnB